MRLVHKATDRLTAEAQALMVMGFRQKKTYAAIARDLAEIGVPVPERTIARRGAEWRMEESRRAAVREQVGALVEAAKANPEASEIVRALATDALMAGPEGFQSSDPIKLQRLNLRAEELRLKREELEIKRRLASAEEMRLKLLEAREQRAIAAVTDQAEQMTPEERIRRIREIYGLGDGGAN